MKRLIIIALIAAAGIAGCGGRTDSSVKADLQNLMTLKGPANYQSVGMCAHQTGNEYVCQVYFTDGSHQTVNVTDDGKTVYEQGNLMNGLDFTSKEAQENLRVWERRQVGLTGELFTSAILIPLTSKYRVGGTEYKGGGRA